MDITEAFFTIGSHFYMDEKMLMRLSILNCLDTLNTIPIIQAYFTKYYRYIIKCV